MPLGGNNGQTGDHSTQRNWQDRGSGAVIGRAVSYGTVIAPAWQTIGTTLTATVRLVFSRCAGSRGLMVLAVHLHTVHLFLTAGIGQRRIRSKRALQRHCRYHERHQDVQQGGARTMHIYKCSRTTFRR